MADRVRRPALHRSVFARLVVLVLVMAAALLALVSTFYFAVVIPGVHAALDSVLGPHTRAFANMNPDYESARRMASELGMQVRFEGAGGGWTTDADVPSLADLHRLRPHGWRAHVFLPSRTYYVVPVSGGTYIFSRVVSRDLGRVHTQMMLLLLVLMGGVLATAYLVMRRALRPLRLLGTGVARLSEGQLDVVVPKQGEDEFGVLTDAFNDMAARVQEMVRARDRMLRDVSHELRSPLTRMKVALELLPDGEQKRSMAADVAEMEAMVAELLELERLRDGRGLRREPVDLDALAREAAERLGGRPPGVRVAGAPRPVTIHADPEGVRTVLRNLIENALKFSLPDSGPVAVAVSATAGEAVLRVTDDGPGVPAGDVERLFEPFYRPDPSRSRRTGGYGLGLSICRRVMEAHGGRISVEPNAGRGATFVAVFPHRSKER